jgi:hypothetical protein
VSARFPDPLSLLVEVQQNQKNSRLSVLLVDQVEAGSKWMWIGGQLICLSGKGIREREGAIVVLLGNVVGGVYRFFVR